MLPQPAMLHGIKLEADSETHSSKYGECPHSSVKISLYNSVLS